jgi:hypothetical protein
MMLSTRWRTARNNKEISRAIQETISNGKKGYCNRALKEKI